MRAGDLLTVHAELERAGRTSTDVGVRVTAERPNASGPAADVATAQRPSSPSTSRADHARSRPSARWKPA
ncbi:hotdog domain-containing protein [Streptomyces cupreus]|uniref:hotdog domain-containing protein n=1 Tax=Streptomyces cupreus TaxID=2759956 RepID=UPI003AB97FD4